MNDWNTDIDNDPAQYSLISTARRGEEGYLQYLQEVYDYWDYTYLPWMDSVQPRLQQLMFTWFPDFRVHTHSDVLHYLARTRIHAGTLLHRMRFVQKDYEAGIVASEKYPDIEKRRSFYCVPQVAKTFETRPWYMRTKPDGVSMEKYVADTNRTLALVNEWELAKQQAFADTVQPLLRQALPSLEAIEGDWWVIYAVELRESMETFFARLDEVDFTLQIGMPPETLAMDAKGRSDMKTEYYRNRDPKKTIDRFAQWLERTGKTTTAGIASSDIALN